MFSGASNLRSSHATYLKFVEYVDLLVYIIYKKFKNDRKKTKGILGAGKWKRTFCKQFREGFQ